jgi:hypothetical protein
VKAEQLIMSRAKRLKTTEPTSGVTSCPKCAYPLAFKDQLWHCTECGRICNEQELSYRKRARKAFRSAGVVTAFQCLLLSTPFIFNNRIDYGFPNTTLGIAVFLVGLLGIPIWSLPIVWWSHLHWRGLTMNGSPITRTTAASDLLTRWILTMIIMVPAAIAFAVFVMFCVATIASML